MPLATDTYKLAPGLDLRGDPALGVLPQTALRYLFCETVDKELSRSRVVQQRQPKVNGVPSCDIVLIRHRRAATAREVDDALDIELVEHLAEFALVLCREEDALCRDVRQVVEELFDRLRGAEQSEAQIGERRRDGAHFRRPNISAYQDA